MQKPGVAFDDRSDIDIGIEGPGPTPGHVLEAIRDDLEKLPVLYKIDLVDFKSVSSEFYQEAKKTIEKISS